MLSSVRAEVESLTGTGGGKWEKKVESLGKVKGGRGVREGGMARIGIQPGFLSHLFSGSYD